MEEATHDLKQEINLPTGKFLLLTIATAGFYAYYWLLKNTSVISNAAKTPITSEAYLFTLTGLAGWGAYVTSLEPAPAIAGVAFLVSLAAAVMIIVWAFRAKSALRSYAATVHGLDYQMNSFYTFIFGYFYINYCINEIPEEKARLRAFAQRTANP